MGERVSEDAQLKLTDSVSDCGYKDLDRDHHVYAMLWCLWLCRSCFQNLLIIYKISLDHDQKGVLTLFRDNIWRLRMCCMAGWG